jgi:single-stranded-DNA-specific exonuclease
MIQEKVWRLQAEQKERIEALHQTLKVHPSICHLLINRGIDTYDKAKDFFRPHKGLLHNPLLMKNMPLAIDRIFTARRQQEKIMIYGDYDVDGTTSVAIVYDFFNKHYNNFNPYPSVFFYVPHRYNEGYGLSFKGIDEAKKIGCSLLIALDCGTKENEKIAYANTLGIDVIVCDHHTPSATLPPAYALLNPKQKDCRYPFKELSACGIGYKLLMALAKAWKIDDVYVENYLDLVATSIAADIVPMIDENRVLAFLGLEKANTQPCLALKALKALSNHNKPFTISDLVFIISPHINAAGRMDDARKAVELFLATTEEDAVAKALLLKSDNQDRKEIDKYITEEALSMVNAPEYQKRKSTVVFKEDWHKGVVGIIASRLIEYYYKPTIVLTESNGKITGSARSVAGFNIHDAIMACEDLLESYGGHFFAAGLTLLPQNLGAFIEKFETVVAATIQEESLKPIITIDTMLPLSAITQKFYNILDQMQPFGPQSMKPIFGACNVQNKYSKIVKEHHVKFNVMQDGKILNGIGFNLADKFSILQKDMFDMVYTIEENEWQGDKTLQIRVIDIR